MTRSIRKVAVIGAGTMGAGIAGVCANAGFPVVLLDLVEGAAENAVGRLTSGTRPVISQERAQLITCGQLTDDLAKIDDCDWVCEVIVEKLDPKRELFLHLEEFRKPGSIVSSNTSGIPLRDISKDLPERLRRDIAVTHFFNPVHIMKLVELIPGEDTAEDVIPALADFCGNKLGKGAVFAKDTVNFIGNRIGCFWLLSGLHIGEKALKNGMNIETLDALMSEPVGLPPTGLYGLWDLIGLDIMESVGRNLDANLPKGDIGRQYARFPSAEQRMFDRGQLGRKTGGGFYKLIKHDDGTKNKQVFDPISGDWHDAQGVELSAEHKNFTKLMFSDSEEGRFCWDMMSLTLAYAADLVPQIADDIVNIDRAMRWGFNWKQGPFEMIDTIGTDRFAERLREENRPIPKMLAVLEQAGVESFYRNEGSEYLSTEGKYIAVPPE